MCTNEPHEEIFHDVSHIQGFSTLEVSANQQKNFKCCITLSIGTVFKLGSSGSDPTPIKKNKSTCALYLCRRCHQDKDNLRFVSDLTDEKATCYSQNVRILNCVMNCRHRCCSFKQYTVIETGYFQISAVRFHLAHSHATGGDVGSPR